mgnify:CR=1 FL=1
MKSLEGMNNQGEKAAPSSKILAMCRTAVNGKLGSLDDLPHELANTVVNIFYRYFEVCVGWAGTKSGGPPGGSRHGGDKAGLEEKAFMFDGSDTIGSLYSRAKRDHEAIENMRYHLRQSENIVRMVKALRGIDREREPRAYEAKTKYILDMMKYKIKDANKKSDIIRDIERDLNRNAVDEIPDLHKRL